ncbi:MAG: hypothetical protein FJX75_24460 [Armatimonadetes bacterium]|nr:hypothetical protein [Armatimonadota bacterium]
MGAVLAATVLLCAPPHVGAQATIDQVHLLEMEGVARAWLDFLLKAQHQGALTVSVAYDPASDTVERFTQVQNDDHAVPLTQALIWGYRVFEDERYRRGVCDMADFFARAQFPEGGWAYSFTLNADGTITPVWRIANFEEWVQSNGLRVLAAAHVLTGEARYLEAAKRAGEVILRAQDPSGWWPWGAAVAEPDQRPDYLKGPTLNDWSLNACMGDCLVLYHLTGDARYRDAIFRAGEWLLAAQIKGVTPGWAAQYDVNNEPAWARFMEPPGADTVFGTYGAGSVLLMLYDITGDDRYLAPLRVHLDWLRSIPAEQKGWMWYAHRSWTAEENRGTVSEYTRKLTEQYGGALPSAEALNGLAIEAGEPIIAYHYQMVPVDHPEMECYLKPLNGHYGSRSEGAEAWLDRELAKRANGPILDAWNAPVAMAERQSARPTPEACARAYRPDSVAQPLDQLRRWRAGELVPGFVSAAGDRRTIEVARGCSHAIGLLRQLALARVALGQAKPEVVPFYRAPSYTGDFPLVDPARDWYGVGRP